MRQNPLLIILLLFSEGLHAQTYPPACSAIPNPGFELGTSGWSPSGGATTSSTAHSGSLAGSIPASGSMYVQIPILASTTYRFSIWARTTGTVSWAGSGINILNHNYTILSSHTPFSIAGTSVANWTYYEVSFTTGATAKYFGYWISNNGAANLLIDDVCLDIQANYIAPPATNINIMNTGVYCAGTPITFYPEFTFNSNLVSNSSFALGNTGFTSSYTSSTTNACGNYTIATNATSYGWAACTDHTNGAGNMMLVNPSATSGATIWAQTVSVTTSTTYTFSIWVASPSSSYTDPASIQLRVNGTAVSATVLASYQPCNWTQLIGTWNSGSSTSANLSIVNMVGNCTAKDLLLDDIWFSRVATGGTYNWAGPSGFTSTQQFPSISSLTASNAGTYTVTFTPTGGGATYTDTYNLSVSSTCSDCDGTAQVVPTNPSTCTGTDGSILFTTYGSNFGKFEASIDGVNYFPEEYIFVGLRASTYYVQVRLRSNQQHCRTVKIVLTYTDNNLFSGITTTPASTCTSNNGSITINGLASGTEVSWIERVSPVFVSSNLLTGGNTITNLQEGRYFVTVRSITSPFCQKSIVVDLPSLTGSCGAGAICANIGPNLFPNGSFGSGTNPHGTPLSAQETEYGYVRMTCHAPDDGLYSIVQQTDCNLADPAPNGIFNNAWQVINEDHTPGDVGGYMMIVNASFAKDLVFEKQITGLCPNTLYQFSLWIFNLNTGTSQIYPNLTFLINGVGKYTTGNITSSNWVNVGFSFYATATTAVFSVANNAPGGSGNDWIIDDIFVGLCVPSLSNFPTSILCQSTTSQTITTTVTDPIQQYSSYIWQTSTDGGSTWTNVGTAQTATFSGSSYNAAYTIPGPITPSQNGTLYRLAIATSISNLSTSGCIYYSSNVPVNVSPTSSGTVTAGDICQGGTISLTSTVSPSGTYTYQWQQSTSNTGPWSNISGATNASYNFNSSTLGTYWFRISYRDSNNCPWTSSPASVSVVTQPTVSIATSTSAVCEGGQITLNATLSGGAGTCTVQWQSRPNSSGTWTNISGATGVSYIASPPTSTTEYRAVYSCSAPGCCN